MNFWKKLKRPFFILAPMADVTDMAFRQVIVETSRLRGAMARQGPDIFYTEFVSVDGLCSEKSRAKLLPHLKFGENERPIVAQFFGSKPENFYKCAQLAVKLGFDGVDINMGCPASKIVKQDSGAGLILNPKLAQEIIHETKRGIADALQARPVEPGLACKEISVSVKTRIGYNKIVTEEWISQLIEAEPAVIIVHGRTMKEMSKVPTHWDEIGKAALLCHKAGILCVGNGDVMSYAEGLDKASRLNLDGIMIGRGIFHDPWFFVPDAEPEKKTPMKRIELLEKHIKLFVDLWGDPSTSSGRVKNYDVMKRFIKVYISNFDGAKELRDQLMKTKSAQETLTCLAVYKSGYTL